MAEPLYTLRDLLVHELNDLYSAETQLLEALPKMAEAATSPRLVKAFEDHLIVTKAQVKRLEETFKEIDEKIDKEAVCAGMKGLITEGQKLLSQTQAKQAEPATLDAALIAAAQRVEHYEIAGYGCARTYARTLGFGKAADLLQQTLDEEGATDHALTNLAVSEINVQSNEGGYAKGEA
ncbi:MAG: ferritin-like domain-containing protein [bacterium]|nr:ferritin-like domain-containing protein [bacterium]